MADKNLMQAIGGLSHAKPDTNEKTKEKPKEAGGGKEIESMVLRRTENGLHVRHEYKSPERKAGAEYTPPPRPEEFTFGPGQEQEASAHVMHHMKMGGESKHDPAKKKPKVVNLGKGGSFEIKHPGGLHKATHTPEGKNITESKIKSAEHSKNPHVRHMAASAEGLKAMKKG